jgi:hypothetical protein
MKKFLSAILFSSLALTASAADTRADETETPDPNFYVYICFGQSNMEGNAQPEAMDKSNVDDRFQLLATCNYDSPKRTMGNWYKAVPPLVNPVGGLGPTDYFGRTMVAALPQDVRIGVIPVAMGGSPIEMFDKDQYKKKLADNPNEWWAQIAKNHYGGNPYGRIIDLAKKAQKVGVIKGILLHQGCSNCNDPNWPNMVKKIYEDMLTDLGLSAQDVPLFVGEVLRAENGGSCASHNNQVDRMPSVVSTSRVVSSEDCPGNNTDPWHFNPLGYRIIGKRYAFEALKLMGMELKAQDGYKFATAQQKFYSAKNIAVGSELDIMPGNPIAVTVQFNDNHKENAIDQLSFRSDDIAITDGKISGQGDGTVEAVFTDFTGNEVSASFTAHVSYFPFTTTYLQKLAGTVTMDMANKSFNFNSGAQAGWIYSKGVDMSSYKYLVVKLKEPQTCGAAVRIASSTNTSSAGYRDTIDDRTTVCVDLHNMKIYRSQNVVNPAKVFMVSFRSSKKGTLVIDDIFLTNDDQYSTGITEAQADAIRLEETVYTLGGQRVQGQPAQPGIYIRGNRKVAIK